MLRGNSPESASFQAPLHGRQKSSNIWWPPDMIRSGCVLASRASAGLSASAFFSLGAEMLGQDGPVAVS